MSWEAFRTSRAFGLGGPPEHEEAKAQAEAQKKRLQSAKELMLKLDRYNTGQVCTCGRVRTSAISMSLPPFLLLNADVPSASRSLLVSAGLLHQPVDHTRAPLYCSQVTPCDMFAVNRSTLSEGELALLDELMEKFDEIDKDKSASLCIEEVDFYITGNKARLFSKSACVQQLWNVVNIF